MSAEPIDAPYLESAEWKQVLIASRLAMKEVIAKHKKSGHPLVLWRDGKVCFLPPEEAEQEFEQRTKK